MSQSTVESGVRREHVILNESVPARRPMPRLTRRSMLLAGAAMTAAAMGRRAKAAAPPDVPADVDPSSLLTRLVGRITFGINPEELTLARQLGYEGYLEHHLNYTAIDDSALETRLADQSRYSTLTMTYQQMLAVPDAQVASELIEATILRATFSKRQLFERMCDFWTDHFNIDISTQGYYKSIDDRQVTRPNALGSFRTLLGASAHSPAMLYYLNNNVSTVQAPNENYARELEELHTLGSEGGYTQQDVIEVARCFTGWTIYGNNQGALSGNFRFNSGVHDSRQKVVLGNVIPARAATLGEQDGIDVLNILLGHASTAQYVASKLCRYLLGEPAPQAALDAVAAAYTSTNGDIRAMVRAALRPNFLAAAPAKLKRPFHLYISGMRAIPTTINGTASLRSRLLTMGHLPFNWPTPDGYPDSTDFWGANVIGRWNYGADLSAGAIANVAANINGAGGLLVGISDANQAADAINQALFAGEMPLAERNRVRDYMLPNPATETRKRDAAGLALGSPAFQWF